MHLRLFTSVYMVEILCNNRLLCVFSELCVHWHHLVAAEERVFVSKNQQILQITDPVSFPPSPHKMLNIYLLMYHGPGTMLNYLRLTWWSLVQLTLCFNPSQITFSLSQGWGEGIFLPQWEKRSGNCISDLLSHWGRKMN